MEQLLQPVDVIALWEADGKLRPLRLRLLSESGPQRVDILQVVQEKLENRYGWEGIRFLCIAKAGWREYPVELFYSQRNRCWSVSGSV